MIDTRNPLHLLGVLVVSTLISVALVLGLVAGVGVIGKEAEVVSAPADPLPADPLPAETLPVAPSPSPAAEPSGSPVEAPAVAPDVEVGGGLKDAQEPHPSAP